MAVTRHYGSYSETRSNLRSVLQAAHAGMVTTVTRNHQRFVVQPADERATELRRLIRAGAVVAHEGGGWAAYLPGVPVHGDAPSFDDAVTDLVAALRDYAEDWNDRLRLAPNHAHLRSLVELVELSDDDQLRRWLLDEQLTEGAEADARARA